MGDGAHRLARASKVLNCTDYTVSDSSFSRTWVTRYLHRDSCLPWTLRDLSIACENWPVNGLETSELIVEIAAAIHMFCSSASDYTILETLGHSRRTAAKCLA